jgi:Zn-dependent protease with chaperone function
MEGKMNEKVEKSHKRKVWLFSILGYVYIAAIVLAVTAAALLLVYSAAKIHVGYAIYKVLMTLGVFLFIIMRALWVKFDKPAGLQVDEKNNPELAAFISELRAEVGGSSNYRIFLTDDFNASVIQYPRLGIFGWYRDYVLIGVPLLLILSLDELKGVLAHEFGHLKGTHGIWAVKVYRNREVWLQIMQNLEEKDHWGAFLFKGFFKWYLPKLEEYSLSLYREQEFEADEEAVRIAGKDAFGRFLLKYDIYAGRLSDSFWREIYRKMQTCPEPDARVFEEMSKFLELPVEKEYQDKIIERELKVQTGEQDTHPALCDRIRAAGYEAASFVMAECDAADRLLGGSKEEILQSLGRLWKEEISGYWEYRHEELQKLQVELGELEGAGEFNETSLLRMGKILEELDREEEALMRYDEVLAMESSNLEAMFSKGKILITGDGVGEEGKNLIDQVMEIDNEYSYYGTQLVYKYLVQKGRTEESEAYYDAGMREVERLDEAVEEREYIKLKDIFVPHGLEAEKIDHIIEQMSGKEKIKEIYLVRKETAHYSEEPLFVLGVLFKSANEKYQLSAIQEIAESVKFPGETLVISLNLENFRFHKKQKKVDQSLIFSRSLGD